MDILLNETESEYVMFQLDLFWLVSAGTEPSRSLELFRGRMRYIHCKDYLIRPPRRVECWSLFPVPLHRWAPAICVGLKS